MANEYNLPLQIVVPPTLALTAIDQIFGLTIKEHIRVTYCESTLGALAVATFTSQIKNSRTAASATMAITVAGTLVNTGAIAIEFMPGDILQLGATGIGTTPVGLVFNLWYLPMRR